MRQLGLFEGIGGFFLAGRWMGWEQKAWVEIDPFCQKILKKHFKNAKGYGDIKEFDGTEWKGKIDIITGGFPCQPFSVAGQRKGEADERYLWEEMLRVIREVKPPFVVGENVGGILSMGQPIGTTQMGDEELAEWMESSVLTEIIESLEKEGYQVQPFVIPASAVNAPHRRDRVWIIAHSNGHTKRQDGCSNRTSKKRGSSLQKEDKGRAQSINEYNGCSQLQHGEKQSIADTTSEGLEGCTRTGIQWEKHWIEVATEFCRVDDGVSPRLDKFRKDRLKALGNAIVPQVAFEIFKAIEAVYCQR